MTTTPIIKMYGLRDRIIRFIQCLLAVVIFLVSCNRAAAQIEANKGLVDSNAYYVQQYNKFVDSLSAHTTVKQFRDYLDTKVTSKFFREGTLTDLLAYFIQENYTLWIQNINKPKPK